MKFSFRVFGTVALAAIGASMAHGNAYGFGSSYASASYYESGAGLYITAMSGQYYSYSQSWVGTSWANYDSNGGSSSPYPQYSSGYGYSDSGTQVGGAGFNSWIETYNSVTFTNEGNNWATLDVHAQTIGYATSYAGSWNDVGFGAGSGWVYDSAGSILQYSLGYSELAGLGYYGGNFTIARNFDPYNGTVETDQSFGQIFPIYATASDSDYQIYAVSLAPGASDTFYTRSIEAHEAYSITPGPAAVAPFAFGLVGALRRRRR